MSESYRVLKFGGSSVGAPERIARVVQLIARERALGPTAVVVSAMGDTTDWLLAAVDAAASGDAESAEKLATEIEELARTNLRDAWQHLQQEHPDKALDEAVYGEVDALVSELKKILYGISLIRERSLQTTDLVLSFGERISNQILAALLNGIGVGAVFQDAREWTVTNERFGDALVDWAATYERLQAARKSWGDRVPLNTGFLGRTPDGRTTTLGRNGSDYTATLLARGLHAREVQIWTDVSGVMTADPGLVAEAYPLERLSYMEALELACFGTRMFHPRTMIPLIESGIPMRIRNTMRPDDPGTIVSTSYDDEENRPTSVTSLENVALIDVELRRIAHQAMIGERVLHALHSRGISSWMSVQAGHGQAIAVAVPLDDVERAVASIREELEDEFARFEVDPIDVYAPVSLVSLVAETMGRVPMVAGRFFTALGAAGVNIRAIAQGATGRSISCVVDADDTSTAVRAVHSAFNFAHQEVSVFLLGRGTVGSQLLDQIAAQRDFLREEHDINLNVVGLASSRKVVFDEDGIDLAAWSRRLDEASDAPGPVLEITQQTFEQLARMPVPILVDCTAADGMQEVYRRAFEAGIHVVAANKKPLTVPWSEREELMRDARKHHAEFHYETTVGASLPVIDTLKNLVRTGDSVELIEGSFSGTLGYLTNELMQGVPVSTAVKKAKELGYTEPMPQDDLSGLDVARKALILARELDFPIEMSEVEVTPLVPESIIEQTDLDAFFQALEDYDEDFAREIDGYRSEGKALRYVAQIDPHGGATKLKVSPIAVPLDHPAASLRGSEAFVAFTTARYRDYPLIVRGSGAGGAVTAAGVLADVLRISQALRGR